MLALLVVLAEVAFAAEAPRVVRPHVFVPTDGRLLQVSALVVAVGAELARVNLPHLLAADTLAKEARLDFPGGVVVQILNF